MSWIPELLRLTRFTRSLALAQLLRTASLRRLRPALDAANVLKLSLEAAHGPPTATDGGFVGGTRVDHGDGHVVQVQEFKSQSTLASTHVQHTATRGHLCTAKGRDEESSKRCSATAAIFVVASAMLLAAYLKCV